MVRRSLGLLTELDLARRVRELARQFGWLPVHFRPAQTVHGWCTPSSGDAGFPDGDSEYRSERVRCQLETRTDIG